MLLIKLTVSACAQLSASKAPESGVWAPNSQRLFLTYAAKQTDQGKKSVALWFEQEKDQGYRLTTVDATNLLDAKEKTSSEKEITTEKEKKGTEFAQLIQQLGNPQRLVWGEMPDGGMGYRATYQLPGQPEVVMEFKKKAKKLVLV